MRYNSCKLILYSKLDSCFTLGFLRVNLLNSFHLSIKTNVNENYIHLPHLLPLIYYSKEHTPSSPYTHSNNVPVFFGQLGIALGGECTFRFRLLINEKPEVMWCFRRDFAVHAVAAISHIVAVTAHIIYDYSHIGCNSICIGCNIPHVGCNSLDTPFRTYRYFP